MFIELVKQALEGVAPVYYQAYRGLESSLEYLPGTSSREHYPLLNHLRKHHERVFCYELYHQVRVLMDNDPRLFEGVCLQGELKKFQIEPMFREAFGIVALDKEFVPDFLFHGPGDFNNQELVIEVKAESCLGFSALRHDLEKIQQFISNYRYKAGLFLSVNTLPKVIRTMMADPERRQWVATALPSADKIFWVWKQNDQTLTEMRCFNQFIEANAWADVVI
jgi:hypothetical protein